MAVLLHETLDDALVSWFSDRLSHRPRRGQSGVWLSVFRGSDQVWSRVHLVCSEWCCGRPVTASLIQKMVRLHTCVMCCPLPPPGEKGTITAWATAPTTTFDDRAKFRGCRGRRSSPSPQARCTVCAAPRMVGVTIKAPSFYLHTSHSFSFSLLAAILPFGAVKSPQFS